MKVYGILGICWVNLITGEIKGKKFFMYRACDRIRITSFNGQAIEINEDPHDISKWVEDNKPEGLKGLKTKYKRAPYVVIDGEVYDLVDKTK